MREFVTIKSASLRECLWLLLEAYVTYQAAQGIQNFAEADSFARALFKPRRTDARYLFEVVVRGEGG